VVPSPRVPRPFAALVAVPALAIAAGACGAGSPDAAVVDSQALSLPTLGDDAGCADRDRAQPVCLQAVAARCTSQRTDCEAMCESRQQPGSSEKEPALRGDFEADRCNEGCRVGAGACRSALAARCPRRCAGEADAAMPTP
jgi:hypothetical protein